LPFVTAVKSSGEVVYLSYPMVRLVIFFASVVIGVAMWLALNRTRIGMIVRAGVDDRDILAAMGVRIQLVFVLVFALVPGLRAWPVSSAVRFSRSRPAKTPGSCSPRSSSSSSAAWDRSRVLRSCAHHRARRATRLGLHPDLRDRGDIPDHGARAGHSPQGLLAGR